MVEKIDISNITIDDLHVKHDDIQVITLAKVGTTIFSSSLQRVYTNGINHNHTHGINVLEYILEKNKQENKKTLIISGIRNPLDRNISFFFDSFFLEECLPELKLFDNMYCKIKNTFVCNKDELNNIESEELINIFKNKDEFYHNHFTLWLEQFFEITKINEIEFDKEKGVQLYKLNDDIYILFYVLEKYNENRDDLERFLKISLFERRNVITDKEEFIANKYKDFKKKINFDYIYKDSLLNTSVIKYFYSDELIHKFNSLY